jgi:hypothetical protein
MRRGVAIVVVTVATLLATAASGPTTTSTERSSAEQLARTGVLQRSDVPANWKETARGADSARELEALGAKIPSCKSFRSFSAVTRRQPHADSDNFQVGQSNVTSTVSVFPSTDRAVAAVKTFGDDRVRRCLQQLLSVVYRREIARDKKTAKQLTSVKTTLGREQGIRLGDAAVVYQGTFVAAFKNGTEQTIGVGFLAVRAGRALAGYTYSSDTDISSALQPAIVASVTRLQRAASPA